MRRRRPEVRGNAAQPHPSSRARRLARGAWLATLWSALGALVTLVVLTSLSPLVGVRPFTVLTGSMEPAIGVGAIVFDRPIEPLEARPGDVVTFPDPEDKGRQITHRLRGMTVKGELAYMVTRGDANDAPERWTVPLRDEIGRVAYVAPKIGYVRAWITGMWGRAGVGALVLLWGALALFEIWRPSRAEGGSSGDSGNASADPRAPLALGAGTNR